MTANAGPPLGHEPSNVFSASDFRGSDAKLIEIVEKVFLEALGSPATGPVVWTFEATARKDSQARYCAEIVVQRLRQALAGGGGKVDRVLIPTDPGTCELDDSGWILAFLNGLHAHLPEDERPTSWMQLTDDQRDRIKAAYRAMIAAL